MIYITGDVHSKLKKHWEQKKTSKSEIDCALEWLKILKKENLKSTLFINGKCLKEYPEKIKKVLKYEVEIGGHTYDNFGEIGIIKSYFYRKIFRAVYGPKIIQKRDIKKTKKEFEKLGLKMNLWRTHAFGSNDKTFELLRKNNVKYVSDLIGDILPFKKKGIIHAPINIPVDNNTLAYGKMVPENRNPFAGCTKGRIRPEEWFDIMKKRIKENEKKKRDSILLIHPITMKVLDDFKIFKKIARFLSKYKSGVISDIKPK